MIFSYILIVELLFQNKTHFKIIINKILENYPKVLLWFGLSIIISFRFNFSFVYFKSIVYEFFFF